MFVFGVTIAARVYQLVGTIAEKFDGAATQI